MKKIQMCEADLKKLFKFGKNIISNWKQNEIESLSSWLILSCNLAETVDEYKYLNGNQKKKLIIKIISLLIEDKDTIKDFDINIKNNLIMFMKDGLSTALDLIVEASNGKININKKKQNSTFFCF
tara:strand:+ start:104 stop:478 length:375 start_codon:yes stop_codon:yes gene_type:complete